MADRVEEATLLLAAIGFVAAFIDAQVGGGGVLTLPSLLLAGLPPHMALGTNKLGGTASALVASANYLRAGAVPVRQALLLFPFALAGGGLGVWLVLRSPATWLAPVVIVLMAAMCAHVLLRPHFGAAARLAAGPWPLAAMAVAAFLVGTYDGVLGPGTGTLLIFALVAILGHAFRRAAALGRILNLASNTSALAYFAWAGQIHWGHGLPLAMSMAVGGYAGSHVTLRHGDRVVRPLFVAMTLVLLVVLADRMA